MRVGTAGLNATLPNEVCSLARLWTIDTKTPIRFTDSDNVVVYNGDTYSNDIGFTASAIVSAINSQSQGADISTTLGTEITAERINAGYFDNADVHLWAVDYDHPENGTIKLFGGAIGQIQYDDLGKVDIHVVGLFNNTVNINIESYGHLCRAEFGDARCQFDIFSLKELFTIAATTTGQTFTTNELTQEDGYFRYGVMKFTSGFNNGIVVTVATSHSDAKSVTLFVPTPFPITVGDTGIIYPGCDKTFAMCRDRWNNIIHFRAEPFSPKLAPPGL